MSFRGIDVVEIREVLRAWLRGQGLRKAAEASGVDRKTARRYVAAAVECGLTRDASVDVVDDELLGQVVLTVRPGRPSGHGPAWERLESRHDWLCAWVQGRDPDAPDAPIGRGLTAVKIQELLTRQGCVVPYRTVHRYLSQQCGYRPVASSVRVDDGAAGDEVQIDFGYLGMLTDQDTGHRHKVHALIFTAVLSRHMFVWLAFSQTLAAVVTGCEAAWRFFGGVFKVVVPDNLSPVVKDADPVNPVFTAGWLDYQQHAGFITDPARVRSPKDKSRVERQVQFVRSSMWDGEVFTSLSQAQSHAETWAAERAGHRVHGTTRQRPAEVFTTVEKPCLLPVPPVYDPPVFKDVKVHQDLHFQIGKALYSAPAHLVGRTLQVRADSQLVKAWHKGVLVKTHPRQLPGSRSTDPGDMPEKKTVYAMRDVNTLSRRAHAHGDAIGAYADKVLDDPLPWTRMRSVYRLLGLADRYGNTIVDQACRTALDLDVISVTRIVNMVENATERHQASLPGVTIQGGRFARPASQFMVDRPRLVVIPGGLISQSQPRQEPLL